MHRESLGVVFVLWPRFLTKNGSFANIYILKIILFLTKDGSFGNILILTIILFLTKDGSFANILVLIIIRFPTKDGSDSTPGKAGLASPCLISVYPHTACVRVS